jgi:hypothetical protein
VFQKNLAAGKPPELADKECCPVETFLKRVRLVKDGKGSRATNDREDSGTGDAVEPAIFG